MFLFYVFEFKINKQNFRLSVWLSACTYICTTWVLSHGHNNFRKSQQKQIKFRECLLCIKCSSGIEIQSKIMILILILILNKILILTNTYGMVPVGIFDTCAKIILLGHIWHIVAAIYCPL